MRRRDFGHAFRCLPSYAYVLLVTIYTFVRARLCCQRWRTFGIRRFALRRCLPPLPPLVRRGEQIGSDDVVGSSLTVAVTDCIWGDRRFRCFGNFSFIGDFLTDFFDFGVDNGVRLKRPIPRLKNGSFVVNIILSNDKYIFRKERKKERNRVSNGPDSCSNGPTSSRLSLTKRLPEMLKC